MKNELMILSFLLGNNKSEHFVLLKLEKGNDFQLNFGDVSINASLLFIADSYQEAEQYVLANDV